MINTSRLEYLDGLRGVAALAVVIFHMNIFFSIALPYDGILGLLRLAQGRLTNGNFAVCLFFVLSGYVLTVPFRTEARRKKLGEATVKRYFRLTPVVFASVVISFFLWMTVGYRTTEMLQYGPGFAYMGEAYNFTPSFIDAILSGLFTSYAGNYQYNEPLWTISVELWGSMMLFAFIGLFYSSKNYLIISFATSIILILMMGYNGIYYSLFLAGSCLHRVKLNYFHPLFIILAIYLGSIDAWSKDAIFLFNYVGLELTGFQHTIPPHAIGSIILVGCILNSAVSQKLLSARPLRFLGNISFALYAIHIPVIFSIGNLVFVKTYTSIDPQYAAIITIATVLIVCIVAADLMYRLIDVPAQTAAKKISSWLIGDSKNSINMPTGQRLPDPMQIQTEPLK